MTSSVDVTIAAQRSRREAMRFFPRPPSKRRKAITQADVAAAVNAKLDDLDREFCRLMVEFPKFRAAYDTARVTVKNARVTP